MSNHVFERPTSPHLGIYRWQITNTLSILHRMTGFALGIGSLLLVAWLVAAAYSPEWFDVLHAYLATIIGQVLLWGWAAAFYYHLANGLRHLFWDIGAGFKVTTLTKSGIAVLLFTALMTAITAYCVYFR